MKFVRWVAFLPGAFIGLICIGYVLEFIHRFLFPQYIGDITNIFRGLIMGSIFMVIGINIAPENPRLVKWLLILPLLALSLVSMSSYLIEEGSMDGYVGFGYFITVIYILRTPANEFYYSYKHISKKPNG